MKKLLLLISVAFLISSFSPKKITWVAIGDSITYLNDHLDETGNRLKKGYLTRVTEQLPNIQYINQGHNGWTSGGIADAIDSLGIIKADVYTDFLCTYDWWQGRNIGELSDYVHNTGNNTVYGSFRIILNKIKTLNPAAKIILITPMQRTDFVYVADKHNNAYGCYKEKNNQSLAAFAAAINGIARYEHCAVIDLYNKSGITVSNAVKYKRLKDPQTGEYKNYTYPKYIDIPFNPDTDEYPYPADAIGTTYDGLHPSDKGCAIIAGMLVKVLKQYHF
jgi:lysophospholipase L1-like esterase